MTILVTGANGQLGNELKLLAPSSRGNEFIFTDVGELDITDKNGLSSFLKKTKPDVIINCAAFTAVDLAQKEKANAYMLNKTAVLNIAEISEKNKSLLIHISTDYVFDGRNHKPYRETDLTGPQSVYGSSKLEGELEVILNTRKAIIIRTSWLYSSFGNNFVKTILRLAAEKGEINVVSDQIGTPTYARDLADAILKIIPASKKFSSAEIFHYSNEGVASWYDFAKAIVELAGIKCIVNPIDTQMYPTPAARPPYSVLSKNKIKKEFGIKIPYWKDSLSDCLDALLPKQKA